MKLSTVPPPEAEQKELGRQLIEQHHKAIGGIYEYVALGALVQRVRAFAAVERGVGSTAEPTPPTGGRYAANSGLKGWLSEYANGEISEASAYNYAALADSVKNEFSLGDTTDLHFLLKGDDLTEGERGRREKIKSFLAGKSQRQLLIGIGKFGAKRGGARTRKNKPPTEDEKRAAWLEEAQSRAHSVFSELHDLDDRWQTLSDAQLRVAAADAERFAARARKWLATPSPARVQFNLEKYSREREAR